jgi:Uma2 family endonuclease
VEEQNMSTATLITADELLRMPYDGYRYELVAGELRRMSPPGWKHGKIGGVLHVLLGRHVFEHRLGNLFMAETGFLLARDPDTVRAPDIAFIHRDHIPKEQPKDAYWPGAPDLAVEVVSPGDTMNELDEKVQEWLGAGSLMVWVVKPKSRSVIVYRSTTDVKVLTEKDELSGDDVVPGFRCSVREIFESDY